MAVNKSDLGPNIGFLCPAQKESDQHENVRDESPQSGHVSTEHCSNVVHGLKKNKHYLWWFIVGALCKSCICGH